MYASRRMPSPYSAKPVQYHLQVKRVWLKPIMPESPKEYGNQFSSTPIEHQLYQSEKALLQGQSKRKLRVCGDYSVTVNPQLETHRQPIPLPEDLMRKLRAGHGFTKLDLADANNQINLAPESQSRLALSTHKGVLLQKILPFGISSAPGYFQQIMEQLTQDLPGVVVYLYDILVSGETSEDHLSNLQRLLQRLENKGLRYRLEKCYIAQDTV